MERPPIQLWHKGLVFAVTEQSAVQPHLQDDLCIFAPRLRFILGTRKSSRTAGERDKLCNFIFSELHGLLARFLLIIVKFFSV